MCRCIGLALLVSLVGLAGLAEAAYKDGKIARVDERGPTKQLIVEFEGDADEKTEVFSYTVTDSTTWDGFRKWSGSHKDMLNKVKTNSEDPRFVVGQTIPSLPLDPPARSGQATCLLKLDWYHKLVGKGFVGTLAAVAGTLKTDLERECKPEHFQ